MTAHNWCFAALLVLSTGLQAGAGGLADEAAVQAESSQSEGVDLFDAMKAGSVDVKFIAKSDKAARLLITNKTDSEVQVRLPEAFVGMPVVAQFGGGGGGMGIGGGGGGGGGGQSLGGGGGGMGGGMGGGGMGGGGGQFSIPAEKMAKINVDMLCMDHGLKDPSSSKPYTIAPVEAKTDRPEVVELLKAFGRGELNHHAAQAAVWFLQNDVSWQELAAKQTGTVRNVNRQPYFSREELKMAMAYATEAKRRGELQKLETEPSESMGDSESTADIVSPGSEEPTSEVITDAPAEAAE